MRTKDRLSDEPIFVVIETKNIVGIEIDFFNLNFMGFVV